MAGEVIQAVECLPRKCVALSSNSRTNQKRNIKKLPMSTSQLELIYVHYPQAVLLISTIPSLFIEFTKFTKYYVK
jgi:hypothetical protein